MGKCLILRIRQPVSPVQPQRVSAKITSIFSVILVTSDCLPFLFSFFLSFLSISSVGYKKNWEKEGRAWWHRDRSDLQWLKLRHNYVHKANYTANNNNIFSSFWDLLIHIHLRNVNYLELNINSRWSMCNVLKLYPRCLCISGLLCL